MIGARRLGDLVGDGAELRYSRVVAAEEHDGVPRTEHEDADCGAARDVAVGRGESNLLGDVGSGAHDREPVGGARGRRRVILDARDGTEDVDDLRGSALRKERADAPDHRAARGDVVASLRGVGGRHRGGHRGRMPGRPLIGGPSGDGRTIVDHEGPGPKVDVVAGELRDRARGRVHLFELGTARADVDAAFFVVLDVSRSLARTRADLRSARREEGVREEAGLTPPLVCVYEGLAGRSVRLRQPPRGIHEDRLVPRDDGDAPLVEGLFARVGRVDVRAADERAPDRVRGPRGSDGNVIRAAREVGERLLRVVRER